MIAVAGALLLGLANAGSSQTIDDFESYSDTVQLLEVWSSGTLDLITPTQGTGTQSLKRESLNAPDSSGPFATRGLSPSLDLSDKTGVAVWVRRQSSAVAPVQFRLRLFDADDGSCTNFDPSVISDTEWHRIVVFLTDCGSADISAIDEIFVSASNMSGGIGDVRVNFDDVEVVEDGIFFDGFEAGDTLRWSSTTP